MSSLDSIPIEIVYIIYEFLPFFNKVAFSRAYPPIFRYAPSYTRDFMDFMLSRWGGLAIDTHYRGTALSGQFILRCLFDNDQRGSTLIYLMPGNWCPSGAWQIDSQFESVLRKVMVREKKSAKDITSTSTSGIALMQVYLKKIAAPDGQTIPEYVANVGDATADVTTQVMYYQDKLVIPCPVVVMKSAHKYI